MNLDTYAKNTWCPGCGNFSILMSVKNAINDMVSEGMSKENFVMVSGIGCNSKIVDYVNVNSFYSIHGRVIPTMTGIKLANKKLIPIGFAGDGGTYDEGISHLIHAAKRNTDVTMVVHDNRVFALTTGQFTATSSKGFRGRSTPNGNIENPLNPIKLMLASGATFVARGYAGNPAHLKGLIKKAVKHKGFSFIEVLQPCVTFNNTFAEYNKKVYDLNSTHYSSSNLNEAFKKSDEWDKKIPIGVFYETFAKTFEENY